MSDLDSLPCVDMDESGTLAILADIHANLEALEAVVAWLHARCVSTGVVLGDVIGYGASPGPALKSVRAHDWQVIRGNHEDMLIDLTHVERTRSLKSSARRALAWTRSQLEPEELRYIEGLPLAARLGSHMFAVHGSLVDPRHCYAYIYEFSLLPNAERFKQMAPPDGSVLLFGHTHQRAVFAVDAEGCQPVELGEDAIELDPHKLHLINPGSVGFSRDGDRRASLMLYEPSTRRLEAVRVEYDVERSAEKIRAAGYDETLAERLLRAR